MATASDYVSRREVTAVAKTTAEWDMVEAQVRERAFFMAGVENARILQHFKDAAREIAAGKLTTNEARKLLREQLRAAGYEPAEDERGGIHDLSSRRRMEVTLRTNVDMARGWMQREQMKKDKSQPGLRLYRAQESRQPRNWADRWKAAADAVDWEGVARGGQMVALIESPIWVELSRFGNPYPPFDFGSKMRVRAVPYEECEKLGLVGGKNTPQPEDEAEEIDDLATDAVDEVGRVMPELSAERLEAALDTPMPREQRKRVEAARTSLNNHLEADVSHLDRKVVQAICELMGALVVEKGGKIISTDLNGTREWTPQEMAEIWKRGLPKWVTKGADFQNMQKEALEQWINKSKQFDTNGTISDTLRQAMQNLLVRLKAQESGEVLYRGLAFKDMAELDGLRKNCAEFYQPLSKKLADSFGTEHNAEKYARGQNQHQQQPNKYQAILILRKHRSGKDLRPLYDAITTVQQNHGQPMKLEGEVLFMQSTRFRVIRVTRTEKRTADGIIYRDTYELEEI